ncbi:MAG: class I SAM-dependent methyltransferase [Proteobacteria bacterium]|nr:class I SAM-dependent methyltransferase [Pseudomonadota bacterium]
MNKDYFEHKAENYEQTKNRVDNVENIANSILSNIDLDKAMHLMDFGSGTGLLLKRIAPYVARITAIDISPSMNKQLNKKRKDLECELEILEIDLAKSRLDRKFDGIISSMTMHHVEDLGSMFENFYAMLNDDGVIAIADLDLEDGSFHTEDTGIFHFGFDRNVFSNFAVAAGFRNVKVISASTVHKPQGDYPIFLLTGNR